MAKTRVDEYGNLYIDNPWYVEDVHQAASDLGIKLTEDEAQDILDITASNFDATIGINWDVFYYHISAMKGN